MEDVRTITERRVKAQQWALWAVKTMIPPPSVRFRMLAGTSWPAMIRIQDAERHTKRRLYRKQSGVLCDGHGHEVPADELKSGYQYEIHPYRSIQGNM